MCSFCDREGSVQPVMDRIIGKRVFRIVGENAEMQGLVRGAKRDRTGHREGD
jgi:hypothetical protein